ncbi:MAG: hypothetical protein ABIH38_01225 [Patescibacteria group bacterium]
MSNVYVERLEAEYRRASNLVKFFVGCLIIVGLVLVLCFKPFFGDRPALDSLCWSTGIVVVGIGAAAFLLMEMKKKMVDGQVDKAFKNFFGFYPQIADIEQFSVTAEGMVRNQLKIKSALLKQTLGAKDALKSAIKEGKMTKAFQYINRCLKQDVDEIFNAYDAAMYRGYLRDVLKERSLEALASL